MVGQEKAEWTAGLFSCPDYLRIIVTDYVKFIDQKLCQDCAGAGEQ